MSGGNIKVVVRCRPLNGRELARGAKGLIRMEGNQTILEPPEQSTNSRAIEKKAQVFSFDKSYWSAGDRNDPSYASQQTLYQDLGVDLLNHSFEGFNTCIFAYGQTGSGKSYSMMGYGADKGIIPLTTSELFRRVEDNKNPNISYSVEVSYIEIYNEKVRDLLNPKNKGNLKVREHPSLGPYVEDLSKLVVENYSQMMTLMDEGNKARTVASTNMNETSSRSHAVFTLILTQKRLDPATKMTGEKVSKISLVDLAGSERQASTGATGTRLKEGANINKSLTTLGKVIAALAQASEAKGKRRKEEFVPYRDSVLTWLLKESLGGNSKTAMIAAISPADYDETLSTLRYADAAKRIKTNAVVNEDPNAKLIRELKEELELLRGRVSQGGSNGEAVFDPSIPPEKQMVTYRTKEGEVKTVSKAVLEDQLEQREKLMADFNRSLEEKMEETRKIHVEREKALEELGISVDKDMVGVHAPQKHPSLVNLNEDPLMSECLVYQLKPGRTMAGSVDGGKAQIKLSGTHICDEHCSFTNTDGDVTLEVHSEEARTFVNGKRVQPGAPVKLLHGFRVILGDVHVFRYNVSCKVVSSLTIKDPAGVRAHRTRMSGMWNVNGSGINSDTPSRSDSPAVVELMDWTAARREVADIECLGDQDLDKLFDDIVKVRTLRGRPDSRLDMLSEFESRVLTASIAGESIADPTTNPWGDGMTSIGTPALVNDTDTSDTRTEGPSDPADSSNSRGDGVSSVRFSLTDDMALEQQALTKQLKTLAQEVKRMRSQAAVARVGGTPAPDITWTPREIVLARKAADKWKCLRNFAMAEQLLTTAGDVREANIIAKQMRRNMSYNFTIVQGPIVNPMSALDDLGGIIEFEDVSDTSAAVNGPQVMVKVIDHESTSVYTWNLHRFQQQLARMRQVLSVKDKPGYSMHLSVHTPFGDSPTPSFSFIGAAQVPLRLLASQISYTVTVPIFCAYTMEAIGSCRVDFKCTGVVRSGVGTPDSTTIGGPVVQSAPFGHKFAFTVTVDSVKGLTSADFTEVHAQARLSSLVGPAIASEDTFASLPVNLDKASVSHLTLRRSLSVLVTSDMVSHLANGYATIEFFARVRRAYLERLERFDLSKETAVEVSGAPERPVMRRAESEFVTPEHHDLLASVEILEMGSDGEYAPAEVEEDIVQLHLGVQRQLCLTLKHASGQSLRWTRILHASAGDVRVMKEWGEPFAVSAEKVNLQLNSVVDYFPDGTSQLVARGTWDTAAHHSTHLDRRTPQDEYVTVQLKFMVEFEGVDEPAVLALDAKLRIIGRDVRRSSLGLNRFWRPKPITNLVALYSMELTPPLARTARELWRLDTARKPVPGENLLNGWRPRSIALVRDYEALTRVRNALSDVQTTKVVLDHAGDVQSTVSDEAGKKELVEKCAKLWIRQMETRVQFDVEKETDAEQEVSQRLQRLVPDLAPRLVPTVTLINSTETIIKRGPLTLLKDSRCNRWEESQAVLRPPYLHLHTDTSSRTPSQVINVSQATVVANPEVEQLLGRRFAFTVFTPTNSYIIQAASARDLEEWITVISRQKKS